MAGSEGRTVHFVAQQRLGVQGAVHFESHVILLIRGEYAHVGGEVGGRIEGVGGAAAAGGQRVAGQEIREAGPGPVHHHAPAFDALEFGGHLDFGQCFHVGQGEFLGFIGAVVLHAQTPGIKVHFVVEADVVVFAGGLGAAAGEFGGKAGFYKLRAAEAAVGIQHFARGVRNAGGVGPRD